MIKMIKKIMVMSFLCGVTQLWGHEIQNNTPFTLEVEMCSGTGPGDCSKYIVGPKTTQNGMPYINSNQFGRSYKYLTSAKIISVDGKPLNSPLILIGERTDNRVVIISFDVQKALGGFIPSERPSDYQ